MKRQVIREIEFCIKNDKFYIASVLTEQLAEVMPVINKNNIQVIEIPH